MYYLFHGPDIVASREALVRLKVKYGDLWVLEASGMGFDVAGVERLFESRPMFSERRLIVIEANIKDLTKSETLKYLKELPDFIDIAFWQPDKIKKTSKFYQFILEKKARTLFFKERIPKKIFPLLDALVLKNKKRALFELDRLLSDGREPLYVLKMILWQIRNLLKVEVKSKAAERLHPFVLKKLRAGAYKFGFEKISKLYKEILKTDVSLKTKNLEPNALLLRLVLNIVE